MAPDPERSQAPTTPKEQAQNDICTSLKNPGRGEGILYALCVHTRGLIYSTFFAFVAQHMLIQYVDQNLAS